jgi:hypothetical protein
MDLPLFGYFMRGKERYFRGHWRVEVPENFRDARQLGREMALAFLRVEPGDGSQQEQLDFLTRFILPDQAAALKKGGNAAEIVVAFWGTIARFAEPVATLFNVGRYRGYSEERTKHEKRQDAIYDAAAKREASERGRHAAKARWSKRGRDD